ncbi:MAG: type II toxin-antitoxin system Phd/YefM family antitoxin [Candidatus Thiosymbion ectosymbiont of Robbea hypermnestra]|nr:type II toxin-antitoxin system Phd/YefM family antitoxin [Candidatus Thiosymbion ectosymbiont of Robbea hypermnestra]
MMESVISLSAFKSDASRLLRKIGEGSESLVLTQNGKARAVVEDYDVHRRRQEALLFLKLMVQGETDVQRGKLTAQEKVFSTVRDRLASDQVENG